MRQPAAGSRFIDIAITLWHSRHMGARYGIRLFAIVLLVATTGLAADAPSTPVGGDFEGSAPAIPTGQEDLLAAMLGKGELLPGECKLTDAQIGEKVVATYQCANGELAVELQHPSVALADATRTENFALHITRGTAPAGFESGLADRIRAREGTFVWLTPSDNPHASVAWLRPLWLVLAAALLALVVFAFRRRGAGSASGT